jgi:magnesium chelatase subunit D
VTDSPPFPFSAIVDREDMKEALVCNAVHPAIGGVLIAGTRGTAKSTAVRSLAELLPPIRAVRDCPYNCPPDDPAAQCADCRERDLSADSAAVEERSTPFVTLPLGATEDRVLGSIDLEAAIQEGEQAFEPGLLARANRGILYVDEVNLLSDHLVDVLLDAVASGTNRVEREGVSVEHPANVLLVGTMNPEEGDLRPQLLDRFGLSVTLDGGLDPADRKQVVRRRTRYDDDPAAMAADWEDEEAELRERIASAQAAVADVSVPDDCLDTIVDICVEHDVAGLRADVVIHRTARALAAFDGRDTVTAADVERAAELALGHRSSAGRAGGPGSPDSPGSGDPPDESGGPDRPPKPPEDELPDLDPGSADQGGDGADADDGGGEDAADAASQEDGTGPDDGADDAGDQPAGDGSGDDPAGREKSEDSEPRAEGRPGDGPDGAPDSEGDDPAADGEARVFPVGSGIDPPALSGAARVDTAASGGRERQRRGSGAAFAGATGRTRRTRGDPAGVDLAASLRAGAPHQPARHRGRETDLAVSLRPSDLRERVRESSPRNLVVFVVDGSGSMGTSDRMSTAKGAVRSLLGDAYRNRDLVSLVGFRGADAAVHLPPTSSVKRAGRELAALPTGGRTPLAAGLTRGLAVIERERRQRQAVSPLLVLVTDGRPTHADEASPVEAAMDAASRVGAAEVSGICFDTEQGPVRMGHVRRLAEAMGARYHRLDEFDSGTVSATVREVIDGGSGPSHEGSLDEL